MIAPTLTTARLVLRPYRMSDFGHRAALFASDRARYIGGPRPLPEVWNAFCADVASWPLLGFGGWSVDLADGTHVGQVGFGHPPHFPERELGWTLHDGFEGQGYATEAAAAARDLAFATLGWDTFVSYIDPDNHASVRVAQRLGAVLDPQAETVAGEESDLVYRHRAGGLS